MVVETPSIIQCWINVNIESQQKLYFNAFIPPLSEYGDITLTLSPYRLVHELERILILKQQVFSRQI